MKLHLFSNDQTKATLSYSRATRRDHRLQANSFSTNEDKDVLAMAIPAFWGSCASEW
jgi:hypothetical protein